MTLAALQALADRKRVHMDTVRLWLREGLRRDVSTGCDGSGTGSRGAARGGGIG